MFEWLLIVLEKAVLITKIFFERSTYSILFLDLDNFKNINDQWGHDMGDIVLKKTGRVLLMFSREADIIVRYGGEEFIAILPNTDKTKGIEVAQELLDTVRTIPCNFGKQTIQQSIRRSTGRAIAVRQA